MSTFFSPVSSRSFRDAPHSRFRCRDSIECLPNFLKMLLVALSQIYTRVFYLRKSIELNSAWVRDFRLYQLSSFSQALARLEMRHAYVLGAGIPFKACLTF